MEALDQVRKKPDRPWATQEPPYIVRAPVERQADKVARIDSAYFRKRLLYCPTAFFDLIAGHVEHRSDADDVAVATAFSE